MKDLSPLQRIKIPALKDAAYRNDDKCWLEVDRFCRDIIGRIDLYDYYLAKGGITPTYAIPGEEGIQPGHVVHFIPDSNTALLAVASDASRWGTHVCVTAEDRRLAIVALGTWKFQMTSAEGTDPRLYLSIFPGLVTQNPIEPGATIQQVICNRQTPKEGSTCLASCLFQPYVLL